MLLELLFSGSIVLILVLNRIANSCRQPFCDQLIELIVASCCQKLNSGQVGRFVIILRSVFKVGPPVQFHSFLTEMHNYLFISLFFGE